MFSAWFSEEEVRITARAEARGVVLGETSRGNSFASPGRALCAFAGKARDAVVDTVVSSTSTTDPCLFSLSTYHATSQRLPGSAALATALHDVVPRSPRVDAARGPLVQLSRQLRNRGRRTQHQRMHHRLHSFTSCRHQPLPAESIPSPTQCTRVAPRARPAGRDAVPSTPMHTDSTAQSIELRGRKRGHRGTEGPR